MTEETTTPRQSRDAKLASAFCDLEPVIRDLGREDCRAGRREKIELGRFAVSQFVRWASDLVRLWNDKHEAA